MDAGRVTNLEPHKPPIPLKGRVIRKYFIQWSPTDKSQLFYLLVDESGNTVEAKISTRMKKVDNKFFLCKCYLMTGYVVDPRQKVGRVVDQAITIIVGDRAEFHAIDDLPIQKQFYSFAPYISIEGRYNPTGKNSSFDSREPIEITLWEKIAFTYANLLARGKVIAVSSPKVTKYLGTLQLKSTLATTILINIAVEGYSEQIRSLKTLTARSSSHYGYQTEDDIRNNLTTIADIFSKNPEEINNHRFSCLARVKEIFAKRIWFSRKCTVCNDRMRREGIMPVVFFNGAMTQVLRVDCAKLVINEGYNDATVLPTQLLELIGQEKIYHLIFKSTETSSIQQTLDVHFTVQPDTEAEILRDESAVSEITSSSTAPQTPAPKASRRQDRQESGFQRHCLHGESCKPPDGKSKNSSFGQLKNIDGKTILKRVSMKSGSGSTNSEGSKNDDGTQLGVKQGESAAVSMVDPSQGKPIMVGPKDVTMEFVPVSQMPTESGLNMSTNQEGTSGLNKDKAPVGKFSYASSVIGGPEKKGINFRPLNSAITCEGEIKCAWE
ncbi:hypothetical protein SSX86_008203 [Deinandra increscens subsp. villosa]|uniref:Uncharacterized protein n=1 Tax=Deinandra increscens subsp. villosa TaxID=3103831 RepID=A0AAP0H3V2_9ASTR